MLKINVSYSVEPPEINEIFIISSNMMLAKLSAHDLILKDRKSFPVFNLM